MGDKDGLRLYGVGYFVSSLEDLIKSGPYLVTQF